MTETLTDRIAITYQSCMWYWVRSKRCWLEMMSTPASKTKKRAMLRRLYIHYDKRFVRDADRYLVLFKRLYGEQG